MDRIITLNEVAKHKNQSSVWIIIHDSVYDVTSYLEEHPGGSDILLEVAGKDGTQGFEDIAHSDDARELLKKYKVGVIDPTEIPTTEKPSIIEWYRTSLYISQFTFIDKLKKRPSCQYVEDMDSKEKSWRTYDGSSRRPPSRPCESSKLKWAVIALAGAVVIGFAMHRYLSK
ncbi:unnamed protein product [Leptidea sinapis]|uniref:Cytochrome b5 heme-binding domain-containing protein n=1 Tax=Leptidea sinapis TaxID=189913 RepID=A0A5E4Q7X5_9NEOP|nr:unnamed protein product [Leptidea sinapis]